MNQNFYQRVKNVIVKLFSPASVAPVQNEMQILREHLDIYRILHLREMRKLRLSQINTNSAMLKNPIKNEIIDEASSNLESRSIIGKTTLDLRHELQASLNDEMKTIFKTFSDIECTLLGSTSLNNEEGYFGMRKYLYEDVVKPLLLDEFEKLIQQLSAKESIPSDQLLFLSRKYGAFYSSLSHQNWLPYDADHVDATETQEYDFFGISQTTKEQMSPKNAELIQKHQLINLAKATLLQRQHMNYSPLSLKSTLFPITPKGLFVNGSARAGSILAFFPGVIYTPEYISQQNAIIFKKMFEKDAYHQLCTRYDGVLIDSRSSPYTILNSIQGMNCMAVAHLVNHAPSFQDLNSVLCMVNYTQDTMTEVSKLFLPNAYAGQQQQRSRDEDGIIMHGLCLIANRDIENEEIFFDYRLRGKEFPDWYSVIDDDVLKQANS